MKITAIKTEKIVYPASTLFTILDKYISSLAEGSIIALSSKIVAICEGRVARIDDADKATLIKQEAEYLLPSQKNKYNVTITIKNNILIPTAGIDESNGNGYYILWPSNPQRTANEVREYLCNRFSLQEVGVLITDSKTTPLRWGTTGIAISHSGFAALNNYIGKQDIFGHILKVTKSNIMDALAIAAVLVMGEGNEQTPIAIIDDVPFVQFQQRNPSDEELYEMHIALEDDLYAPLLQSVAWEKGKAGENK